MTNEELKNSLQKSMENQKQKEDKAPAWMRAAPAVGAIAGGGVGAANADKAIKKVKAVAKATSKTTKAKGVAEGLKAGATKAKSLKKVLKGGSLKSKAIAVALGAATGATLGWLPQVMRDGYKALKE